MATTPASARRRALWLGGLLALVATASISAATFGAVRKLPPPQGPQEAPNRVIQALAHWDAHWYLRIAQEGYSYRAGTQSPVAFFPGFPLALRGAGALGLGPWWAGVLLSLGFGLAALWVFSRWAQTLSTPEQATQATMLFACYPFAVYLYGVVYGDGLFLLLVTAAFLMLERGRPGWATLLGALATGTRPVAPAVVVGLLARSLERRLSAGEKLRAQDFLPLLSAGGLLLYMAYLQHAFGDALAFVHTQASPGWDQAPGLRTWLKLSLFEQLKVNEAPLITVRLLAHPALTLLALGLVWPVRRLLGVGYALYVALAVGIPALSSKDFQGMGRYLMAAFPLFLLLPLWAARRPLWVRAVTAASALVLLGAALLFGGDFYLA